MPQAAIEDNDGRREESMERSNAIMEIEEEDSSEHVEEDEEEARQ